MVPDRDDAAGEARVRSALRELAQHAVAEPSHPLALRPAVRTSTRRDQWPRLVAVAAAVVLIAGAVVLLVRRDPGNGAVSDTATIDTATIDTAVIDTAVIDADVTPSTETATGWFAGLAPDTVAVLPVAPISGRIGSAAVWTGTRCWCGVDRTSSMAQKCQCPTALGSIRRQGSGGFCLRPRSSDARTPRRCGPAPK